MATLVEFDGQMIDASRKLHHFVTMMKQEIETLPVINEMALNRVGELFSVAKSMEEMIDKQRKEANGPDQQRIKARNAKAEEIVAPLKVIQRLATEKQAAYHKALEEGRKREQGSLMQAAALLDIEDGDMPLMELPDEPMRTASTTLVHKTVSKWRIKDVTLIPMTFYKLDEEKIDKVIKAGLDVPGIETYEETQTHLRRR